ncbi:RdgB/HAM1 family non-canonical purine NTP pyrophosphatase [candidate division WOR-3 bacterium]|nr:RdgB/HAM1 family non-canonical purine NTP pyrophosphatase [candidate division WOR-3 bacterium]
MPNKLLVATSNKGKLREFKKVLGGIVEIVSPTELSLSPKEIKEGTNYAKNALAKAKAYQDRFDGMICGEDSGLEVDVLGGKPGPLSARYGGEDTSHPEKCRMLLKELEDVPLYERTARFRATIALIDGEEVKTFEGVLEGWVGFEPRGTEGFGYDPIFIPRGFSQSNAELGLVIKNRISHRAKAIRKLAEYLKSR